MATKSLADTIQDQTLEAIQQTQQVVLDAIEAWTSAVSGLVPEQFTLPTLPALEGFPKPAEAIESSFAFAQNVLKLQQDFARKLLVLAEPAPARPARAAKSA